MTSVPTLYEQAIQAGEMMGITLRCGPAPEQQREIPVSHEVGIQISKLLLDYTLEQLRLSEEKAAVLESRQALSAEKGGTAQ